MKIKTVIISMLAIFIFAGCAGSPLGAAMSNHPSEEDVDKMVVDKTTKQEVESKYSGHKSQIMNNLKCNLYHKPSYIGEATKTTYLCFDDKGVLKQKMFM